MEKNQDLRGQFGQVTQQGGVVIQCQHDVRDLSARMYVKAGDPNYYIHSSPATLDPGTSRIDRGDILVSQSRSSTSGGGAPMVMSNVNGMNRMIRAGEIAQAGLSERQVNMRLSESFRFMGIAQGATVPNPDSESEGKLQLTVLAQGTCNVMNNGNANFSPGDTMLWEIPTAEEQKHATKRYGRALEKITLRTVPLKAKHLDYDMALKDVFEATDKSSYDKVTGTVVGEFAYDMKRTAAFFMWMGHYDEAQRADPANAFDTIWDTFLGQTCTHPPPPIVGAGGYAAAGHFGAAGAIPHALQAKFQQLVSNPHFLPIMGNTMTGFLRVQADIDRRKIGKVLSYGKQGQIVDVLVGAG
jgi:hypothetical protein